MAIRAEAVEILVRKSRFEPEVALGVAEAMEVSITLEQLVTVPVLDARLQALTGEIHIEMQKMRTEMQKMHLEIQKFHTELQKVNASLVRWVFLTMLGSVALSMSASTTLRMLTN